MLIYKSKEVRIYQDELPHYEQAVINICGALGILQGDTTKAVSLLIEVIHAVIGLPELVKVPARIIIRTSYSTCYFTHLVRFWAHCS